MDVQLQGYNSTCAIVPILESIYTMYISSNIPFKHSLQSYTNSNSSWNGHHQGISLRKRLSTALVSTAKRPSAVVSPKTARQNRQNTTIFSGQINNYNTWHLALPHSIHVWYIFSYKWTYTCTNIAHIYNPTIQSKASKGQSEGTWFRTTSQRKIQRNKSPKRIKTWGLYESLRFACS